MRSIQSEAPATWRSGGHHVVAGRPNVVTNRRGIIRESTGCPAGLLFSLQNIGKLKGTVAIGVKKNDSTAVKSWNGPTQVKHSLKHPL